MVSISISVDCPYCEQEHMVYSRGECAVDYANDEVIDCQCGGRFTIALDLTTMIIQDKPPAEPQTEIVEFDPNQLTLF